MVVGTSQAAPHVAGLAALLLKRHHRYTPELLAYFLKSNAESRPTNTIPRDPNNIWGHGFAILPAPTATPADPANPTGTGSNQSVTLRWTEAANATGYVVEQYDGRAEPPRFRELPFTETGTDGYVREYTVQLTGAGAVVGNLVNGVRYTHHIKSTNGGNHSKWSKWVHTGAIWPLNTPRNLSGTGRRSGVDLNWTDVEDATGYEVQQWGIRGWMTLPDPNHSYTITSNGSSAKVRGLANDARYYHRVRAVDGSDTSGWTNWISTTTRGIGGDAGNDNTAGQDTAIPPPPSDSDSTDDISGQAAPTPTPPTPQNQPSNLKAGTADGTVILHWTPGTNPNYVKQVVKRREAGARPEVWTDFELDVSARTYTDRTAVSGKTYIYRVKGLRENGRGGTGNRVTVTVR